MTRGSTPAGTPSPGPDGRRHAEQPKWRRDFPIDGPQAADVSRRDFVKFLVLTSGAFVVGQLWIGLHHLLRRARDAPPAKRVAALSDVPVGGAIPFRYPGEDDPCLLLRPDEDTLLAYDQKCTHLACAVQPAMDEGKLHCPCHNGWFEMRTGRVLSGPPTRPLPRIRLEVREGVVYATGVELRT